MSGVTTARPVGPDDHGADYFVFITNVTNTFNRPDLDIDVMHAAFFECHADRAQPARIGEDPHSPVLVTKNIYNLTSIFLFDVGLVVNHHLRALLEARCTVEFREMILKRPFWFPYAPGDRSFEMAGVNLKGRTEEVLARFVNAYGCPPPEERYYEVLVHTGYRKGPTYSDTQTVRLAEDVPEGLSVYPRDVELSRQMIEEHGLVFSRGYLCRPDIFDLLNPYLHRPWFWAQKYLYPPTL